MAKEVTAKSAAAVRSAGTLASGTTFGRYRVDHLLGEGGMGAVYLAHDAGLDRPVALKIPKFEAGDDETPERFLREARIAGSLRHPNLCPVYDVGEQDGVPYLTMAYIDGRPLSERCKPGKLPSPRQAAALVRKIAQAMAKAHEAGIVHRDLKPENVMVDSSGAPIVMDFGLARACDEAQQSRLTQNGMVLGSPAYMSPEQAQGKPELIGPATDIYSLGVVLFELLTGRVPFEGTTGVVIAKLLTKAAPAPRDIRPELDADLDAIVRRMTARKISDRFTSMNEVALALGTWLEKKPEASVPTTAVGPAASSNAGEATSPAYPAPATESAEAAKPASTEGGMMTRAVAAVFATIVAPVAVAFGIKYSDTLVSSLTGKSDSAATESKAGTASKEPSKPDPPPLAGMFEFKEIGPAKKLFNEVDRTGFYTYLQRTKAEKKPPGRNKDPDKVFTIKNGVLRISGEYDGTFTTDKEYSDYLLTVEYKWGKPLKDKGRSGGILLHGTGPDGAYHGDALRSIRCKLTENAAGYLACLTVDDKHAARLTAAMRVRSTTGPAGVHFEHRAGELSTISDGTLCRLSEPGKEAERPAGEWNRIECLCLGDRLMVRLNGTLINAAESLVPNRGKIALQAHNAELFIRRIELQPIAKK